MMSSSAARPAIFVGGGEKSTEASRGGVGGQKNFFKDSRKISFCLQHFLMTFFSNRKLQKITTQQQWYRRRINKSQRRRHPQIVGGAAGARLYALHATRM